MYRRSQVLWITVGSDSWSAFSIRPYSCVNLVPVRPCLVNIQSNCSSAKIRREECAGIMCVRYKAQTELKNKSNYFRHHCHVQLTEIRNVLIHLMLRTHVPYSGKSINQLTLNGTNMKHVAVSSVISCGLKCLHSSSPVFILAQSAMSNSVLFVCSLGP